MRFTLFCIFLLLASPFAEAQTLQPPRPHNLSEQLPADPVSQVTAAGTQPQRVKSDRKYSSHSRQNLYQQRRQQESGLRPGRHQ